MRKWNISIVAILPLAILLILFAFGSNIRTINNNRQLYKTINSLKKNPTFTYTLTLETDYSGVNNEPMFIKDLVQVDQEKGSVVSEHHITEALLKSNPNFPEYMEYNYHHKSMEGYDFRSHPEEAWKEVDSLKGLAMDLNVMVNILATIDFNKKSTKLRKTREDLMYFRIFQPDLEKEPWFNQLSTQIQSEVLRLRPLRKFDHFIDVTINKESKEIVSINLDYSAVADCISVMNGFIAIGSQTPDFEMNYKMNEFKTRH